MNLGFLLLSTTGPKRPSKPDSPVYLVYGPFPEGEIPIIVELKDFAWLLGPTFTRAAPGECPDEDERERDDQSLQRDPVTSVYIPVWSGYNSLIHYNMPVTRVSCLPLAPLTAPAN